MLSISNLRKKVTEKLEALKVFYPHSDGILSIKESDTQGNNTNGVPLKEVKVLNLPSENIWIFENEYAQLDSHNSTVAKEQKGAFSSTGKKVEKTILYLDGKILYIFSIEMKESLTIDKFSSGGKESIPTKFVDSLNHILVFLASSTYFDAYEDLTLFPVGVCCYNYDYLCRLDNIGAKERRKISYSRGSQQKFVKHYAEEGKRCFRIDIAPALWGQVELPVFFFLNPNTPLTDSFDIDFQDFFTKLRTI
jgi:hypothetical protein